MPKAVNMKPALVSSVPIGGGRSLRVRHWDGSGRPLVLLHGLLDDSEGWAELAAGTHRPCLAIDLPGFGGSDLPRMPRIGSYAADVVAALEALEIKDCTLVGHSLGGAVAAAVCSRTPAVASLALLAPAGFGRIRLSEAMTLPGVIDVAERALPLALLNPLVCTAAYSTFVAHRRLPSRDLVERLRRRAAGLAPRVCRPSYAPSGPHRPPPTRALVERLRRRAWQSGPGVRAAGEGIAHAGGDPRGFPQRWIDFDRPVAALWGRHDAL